MTRTTGKREGRRGNIMLEFALSVSLLMLLLAGAGDFARAFFNAITVANAAGTGAFWGGQSVFTAADTAKAEQIAEDDAADLDGVVGSTEMFCECPDATETDCFEGTCASSYQPRVFVRTVVQQPFHEFLPWPGVPTDLVVTRETILRMQ